MLSSWSSFFKRRHFCEHSTDAKQKWSSIITYCTCIFDKLSSTNFTKLDFTASVISFIEFFSYLGTFAWIYFTCIFHLGMFLIHCCFHWKDFICHLRFEIFFYCFTSHFLLFVDDSDMIMIFRLYKYVVSCKLC